MREFDVGYRGPGYYRNRGADLGGTSAEMRLDVEFPTGLCDRDHIQIRMLEAVGLGGEELPCETAVCLSRADAVALAIVILRCAADDYSDLPPELRPEDRPDGP